MSLMPIIHKNAKEKMLEKYNISSLHCYSNPQEMIGMGDSDSVVVFNSLDDIGSKMRVLQALRYMWEQGIKLLVLDNEDISTATIRKREGKYVTEELTSAFFNVTVGEILHYVDDEMTTYGFPENFVEVYWSYEFGNIKLTDVTKGLQISKPYFYKLCDIYETTIDYFYRYHRIEDIIAIPKKREHDFEEIFELWKPFLNDGLTFNAVRTLQSKLNLTWIELWRTILSYHKSKFLYYLLRDDYDLKSKTLFQDLNYTVKVLKKQPQRILELNTFDMENNTLNDTRLPFILK